MPLAGALDEPWQLALALAAAVALGARAAPIAVLVAGAAAGVLAVLVLGAALPG